MDLWGWCEGSLDGNLPPGLLCWNMDLTLVGTVAPGGCWVAWRGLEIFGLETESAVSKVVGKSISLWIWIPSPGPMWLIWLKLEGAEIIFERRSAFLQSDLESLANDLCFWNSNGTKNSWNVIKTLNSINFRWNYGFYHLVITSKKWQSLGQVTDISQVTSLP